MVDQPTNDEDGFFLEDEDILAAEPHAVENADRPNLREIWRKNPSLKVFAAVAGVVLFSITVWAFSGGEEAAKPDEQSVVATAGDVSQPPGTAELPPAYEEAVRQATEQRIQDALQTGGSALPTPIARPAERIEAPVQIEEQDPLSEWRREAETRRAERKKQAEEKQVEEKAPEPVAPAPTIVQPLPVAPMIEQVQAVPVTPVQPPPPLPTEPTPDQVQAYAQALSQQLGTVLETKVPKESVLIKMGIEQNNNASAGTGATAQAQPASYNNATAATASSDAPKAKPIIPAGTIAYGQTLIAADSDVPGPVLVEVASGPLAGGRAIGSFQVAEDKLVLQFNRIVKDGVEYQINAYALDPGTTLTGMSTDVDHHYWSRIILPGAARFVQGFAQAATQQDNQVVVTNGTVVTSNQNDLDVTEQVLSGLNAAGQRASQVIQEDAERPITVRLAMGTRIGLLFTESVYDPDTQANMNAQQRQSWGQAAFSATPYGQAYNAVSNVNWGAQQPGGQQQYQQYAPYQMQQYQQPYTQYPQVQYPPQSLTGQ